MQIESQSQRTEQAANNFFVPTGLEITLYTLLGAVFLVIFNSASLIKWIGSYYAGSPQKLAVNISVLNNGISHSLSTAFGGRLGQIMVWALIGAGAYVALWFFKNLFNSFENDVIINHYLHPINYSRAGYWGSAIAAKIFFGVMFVLFIIYSYLALTVVMPAASALAGSAVYHFKFPQGVGYIALSLLIAAALIYAWFVMGRLTRHLWKLL